MQVVPLESQVSLRFQKASKSSVFLSTLNPIRIENFEASKFVSEDHAWMFDMATLGFSLQPSCHWLLTPVVARFLYAQEWID